MGSEAPRPTVRETSQEATQRRKLSPGPGLAAADVTAHQLARIHDATVRIVAERGYRALKVRDIVSQAEVSTRAFYEHFGSKEDCFLHAHELISRRATRRMMAGQRGEQDWRERPRLVFDEFARQLENDPDGARLALVEAYAAGTASLEQAWRAERIFKGMLAESLARPPRGAALPPLIVEGIVAGFAGVARKRLLTGSVGQLAGGRDGLINWVLGYADPAAVDLARLDRHSVWRDTTLEAPAPFNGEADTMPSRGDRALLVAAVAELTVANGYARLTAPRVRARAGVSRRKFDAHFDNLEDCYMSALELRAGEALAQASRAQAAAGSREGGVYRAIAALCDYVVSDPFLVRVCLTDEFPEGGRGTRARRRLITATTELLGDSLSNSSRSTRLVTEASLCALWSLFHRHVIREWPQRREISATLAYVALAPSVGASVVETAIRREQGPREH